jgi:hypothetical protein
VEVVEVLLLPLLLSLAVAHDQAQANSYAMPCPDAYYEMVADVQEIVVQAWV